MRLDIWSCTSILTKLRVMRFICVYIWYFPSCSWIGKATCVGVLGAELTWNLVGGLHTQARGKYLVCIGVNGVCSYGFLCASSVGCVWVWVCRNSIGSRRRGKVHHALCWAVVLGQIPFRC